MSTVTIAETKPKVVEATRPRQRTASAGLLFALPHLILFSVFLLWPTIFGFYISLHRWHILAKTHPFIGLGNYSAALTDDIFWLSVRNTFYFVVLAVPAGNLVSLLLALGLNSLRRYQTFYKVLFYMPVVISIAVVAVLWGWLYNTEIGLLNVYLKGCVDGLRHLGLPLPAFQPIPWLSDPKFAMPSIALMSIWWGAGGNMILYLAGLNNIPDDYMEAAQIDGANAWKRFWHITWPLLRPTTLFCLVFSVLASFQIFGQSYVLYAPGSGPARSALTMALYMYQQGFSEYEIGYGAAVGYLMFALVLVFTILQFRLFANRDDVSSPAKPRRSS
jgi:multiple sugar transport system permease protein